MFPPWFPAFNFSTATVWGFFRNFRCSLCPKVPEKMRRKHAFLSGLPTCQIQGHRKRLNDTCFWKYVSTSSYDSPLVGWTNPKKLRSIKHPNSGKETQCPWFFHHGIAKRPKSWSPRRVAAAAGPRTLPLSVGRSLLPPAANRGGGPAGWSGGSGGAAGKVRDRRKTPGKPMISGKTIHPKMAEIVWWIVKSW